MILWCSPFDTDPVKGLHNLLKLVKVLFWENKSDVYYRVLWYSGVHPLICTDPVKGLHNASLTLTCSFHLHSMAGGGLHSINNIYTIAGSSPPLNTKKQICHQWSKPRPRPRPIQWRPIPKYPGRLRLLAHVLPSFLCCSSACAAQPTCNKFWDWCLRMIDFCLRMIDFDHISVFWSCIACQPVHCTAQPPCNNFQKKFRSLIWPNQFFDQLEKSSIKYSVATCQREFWFLPPGEEVL